MPNEYNVNLYVPGFFPDSNCNPEYNYRGYVYNYVWQATQFARFDEYDRKCLRVYPQRSLLVRRYVTQTSIGKPEVVWSDGIYVSKWAYGSLPKYMRIRLPAAFAESLRICGGLRRLPRKVKKNK